MTAAPVIPLPRPVDGAALLDELVAALDKYVITPSPAARDAIVLWIAATHAQAAWNHAPRLVINSPEKRCGKTRLLEFAGATCFAPMMTANVSTAVLYRVIEKYGDSPPTILLDEADTIFGTKIKAEQNEDLRALFNAGHSRSATTWRCVGPQQVPTEFRVYAMAALAGIGQLPDTITDRAVNVTMRRRHTGQQVHPYREKRDGEPLHELRDRLADWIGEHLDELSAADPATGLEDRAADNWAPLVAVADLAGGQWLKRATDAALKLTAEHNLSDAAESLNVQLLRDINGLLRLWPGSFFGSARLATQLRSDEDAPWAELALTPRGLAVRLKAFGIKPDHNAAKTERGYRRDDFTDATLRYVPGDDEDRTPGSGRPATVQASETTADQRKPPDTSRPPDTYKCPAKLSVRDLLAGQTINGTLGHLGHGPVTSTGLDRFAGTGSDPR